MYGCRVCLFVALGVLPLHESLLTVTVDNGTKCRFLGPWKNQMKFMLFYIYVFLNVKLVFCSGGIIMSDDNNNINKNCNYSYSKAIHRISTGNGGVTLIRRRL